MEERKINFKKNDDNTPVLDPDGTLHGMLCVKMETLVKNFSLLLYLLQKGELNEGTKESSAELFEQNSIEILNSLGYEGDINKKYNEYIKEIRSLNHENRELRKQLGMKVSNEDARERLKLITESFDEWWHNEGTGNIDEIIFDRYKMTATLRGGIFPSSREKEIKNQVEMLKKKGFDVSSVTNYGHHLTASEKNFNMLKELFKSAFPHSDIDEINTATYLGGESREEYVYVITKIIVDFNNLDDIKITEP
jgi:regulator of replication initiation timing